MSTNQAIAIKKPSIEEVKSNKGFSVLSENKLIEHENNIQKDPKMQS